ncbi:hypothetical protein J2T13_001399 [Paenibacillus sp. DS2015]|uniref:imm11 family protein n=1 Tax=Paenibacillus sp. DS2015 TaxID=3373917 RepID=UPI003D1BFC19
MKIYELNAHDWTSIRLETLYKMTYKDFPVYRVGKPVISERVKEVIAPVVSNETEILPLIHDDLNLHVLNIINVLDCVDWERTDSRRYKDGSWADFNKLVFDLNRIPDNTYMFKIKEVATVTVYVTEAFKYLIESNNLKGLDFCEVYDSEFTEEKEQEQKLAYEAALAAVDHNKGQEFSYEEAVDRVNQGAAVASGKWKMQLDDKGRLWLGEIILDLSYQWIMPVYIPPVLLGFQWHEVEKSVL